MLKGSIIVLKYTCGGYNISAQAVYDFPRALFGLLAVYLDLEHTQRRSGDTQGVTTKRREPCDFVVHISRSLTGLPSRIFCCLFR